MVFVVAASALYGCESSSAKVDPGADLAVAKAARIKGADLPGYRERAYHPSADEMPARLKRDFANCLHVGTTLFDETRGAQTAHSSDFAKGDATVSSNVEIDPTRASIDKGWKALTLPGVGKCLEQLFQSAIKQDAPADLVTTNATIAKFSLGVGSRSVGYSVKFSASGLGSEFVFYTDLLFIARGRAGISIEVSNVGKPFDRSTEIALAHKMYNRIGTKAI